MFSFNHYRQQISSCFTNAGWVTVYERKAIQDQAVFIFCCLADQKKMKTYTLHNQWEIKPGFEGKPTIEQTNTGLKYRSLAQKGMEPFIFQRSFTYETGYDAYIDISEDFVSYFRLYEKAESKQVRKYYFIDATGRPDEVIKVEEDHVQVKAAYLMEYISVRKMYFVLCFDLVKISETGEPADLPETSISGKDFFYTQDIQPVFSDKTQLRLHGKCWIKYNARKNPSHYLDIKNRKYESFITGTSPDGKSILQDCTLDEKKYLVQTRFKKEVLHKYEKEPGIYKVSTYAIRSKYFTLNMDNSHAAYVTVYLIELGHLPYKEQQHWKKYNVIF